MSRSKPRGQKSHPLDHRLDPLRQRKSRRLQGPNAEEWRLEVEVDLPAGLADCFPPDALAFANNGYGDRLFLVPDSTAVMVFWHEGHETAEYCPSIDDLLPNTKRLPSQHGPITYFGTDQHVMLRDRVFIRYWLFFSGHGTVTYVPGASPLKRAVERDGLAWVRIRMDNGHLVDTIVVDGILQKGTRLVARAAAPEAPRVDACDPPPPWFQSAPAVPEASRPDFSPVVLQPPYDDPVDQFVAATAQELRIATTTLWRSGASAYLDATLRGRSLRLGCNGAMVWILAPLWPSLASYRAGISWAPRDSYLHAKLTEEPITVGLTGNSEFDDLYLVSGEDAVALAANLPLPAQRLLIAHADIIIAIGDVHSDAWQQDWTHESHLRADLMLQTPEADRPGGVRLGEQRFTPIYVASCFRRVAELVAALAPVEPPQLGPAV